VCGSCRVAKVAKAEAFPIREHPGTSRVSVMARASHFARGAFRSNGDPHGPRQAPQTPFLGGDPRARHDRRVSRCARHHANRGCEPRPGRESARGPPSHRAPAARAGFVESARHERRSHPVAKPLRFGHRSAQRGCACRGREGGEAAPPRPQRSVQRARLRRRADVLIIAASADPDWSFAALETTQDKGKSVLRRRGGDSAARPSSSSAGTASG
jgi:hypothetical protein